MTSVFLSYAHDDEPRVRVIKRALLNRGHDVFWDEDIPTGNDWRKVLEERVRRAQCVLVAWSPKSVNSRYVRVECELAAANGRLFPLLLEKVAIPDPFESLQAADLSNWIGNVKNPEWERLVARIEKCEPIPVAPVTVDGAAFKLQSSSAPQAAGSGRGTKAESKGSDLENMVENEIRAALDLSPVQTDALRDITSIRVRGDEAFSAKLVELKKYGYVVVESKAGEALLERKRRFRWGLAAMLTLVFVIPVVFYIIIFPWLPKSHRLYVVQVA
jgi:TIR domain-containing protein